MSLLGQSICTGTDNQKRNKTQHTPETQQTNRRTSALANKTNKP